MPLRDMSRAGIRRRRARHFSAWTFVAPAALIVAVVLAVSVVTGALDARDKEQKKDKAKTVAAVVATQAPGTTTTKAKARFHRVKNGESFSSIADQFKTTVDALTVLNPNVDPLKLTPGSRIRVQ
jgi:LysM repeat protein